MIVFVLAYLAVLTAYYFAQRADARVSEEGFKKGYQEGSELAVKLYGKTPTEGQLVGFNFAQVLVGSMFTVFFPMPVMMGLLVAVPLAAAGRHMLAVRKWRRAFATNGASLNEPKTAWQKFLGI